MMENITEKNKLIAEFMGRTKTEIQSGLPDNWRDNVLFGRIHDDNMLYHYSWDWLMPVVEKIEGSKTSMGYTEFMIRLENKNCLIASNNPKFKNDICINAETKIEAVYNAVVEFIKWYTQTK